MQVKWAKYWRVFEGEVTCADGFTVDDDKDYVYFDIDPDVQSEPLDDDDCRRVHVDDLFDSEEDAEEAAILWLEEAIQTYGQRLHKLQNK